ncbi:MAG: HAMP domain-containing sensor histidine kinase [Planctomycetaceae bacterium]
MTGFLFPSALDEAADRLEADRDAVPWSERLSLASGLRSALSDTAHRDSAMRLVRILADDPKWEVRREVALLLSVVPDDAFAGLAAKLTDDTNGWVQRAAQQSVQRRSRSGGSGRRRGTIPEIAADIDALEMRYGKAVAANIGQLAMKLYDAMAGRAAHEMLNILTPLQADVRRLRSETRQGAGEGEEVINGMIDRLDYLEHYVKDMREYSQMLATERSPARLEEVVDEACRLVTENLRSAGHDPEQVEFASTVDPTIVFPMVRHQMVSAVRNVLMNAYQAVFVRHGRGDGGRVDLNASLVRDTEVLIVVEDDGIGLSPEDLEVLRALVPGGRSRKRTGTGFGLPVVQRCVQLHGGEFTIDSVEQNGTTVTISLPLEES